MVSLVGYDGVDLIPALSSTPERLNVVRFSVPAPERLRKILPIYFLWRIVSLCAYLYHAIAVLVPKGASGVPVDCFLLQNPPAMPLLAVVYIYCTCCRILKRKQPAMVIDWHNLGFSMLSHPMFSRIARIYEERMAPLATAHLCVTNAMKEFLMSQFSIPEETIAVVHDCPPALFQPLSCEDQHGLLVRLHDEICQGCPPLWYQSLDGIQQTLLTEKVGEQYMPRRGRPALITSSTSWTPDEDFGILLDTAIAMDQEISATESSLRVLFVVTGKGPQKEYYMERISKLNLRNVAIHTLWLEPADYPKLLACADLGISLHTSTSGLDLPMKVLDLFGCGVPVCALDFQCLSELVIDGSNGRTFTTSHELQQLLMNLLQPLGMTTSVFAPHSFGDLATYSQFLQGRRRWSENWEQNAKPMLLKAIDTSTIK
jgi:beta-1,4-mannosyltransferase